MNLSQTELSCVIHDVNNVNIQVIAVNAGRIDVINYMIIKSTMIK